MANHFIKEPKEFTEGIRKFQVTDRGHADVFNGVISHLANNDAYLKEKVEAVNKITDVHIKDAVLHVTAANKSKWDGKAENILATESTNGLFSSVEKIKLKNVQENAEVNQNAISNVKVGGAVIQSNSKTAQIELASGSNIVVTGDNASKKITISVNSTGLEADTLDGKHAKITLTTTEKNDLAAAINEVVAIKVDKVSGKQLSSNDYTEAEKNKLAGVAAGANNYVHPASHQASIITQDANNRLTTDAEKTAWNGKAVTLTYNTTITTSWSGSAAPYTQTITINGILADDSPIIDVVLSSTVATALLQEKAWYCVSRITTSNNSITVYCNKRKPVTSIPIQLKVVR